MNTEIAIEWLNVPGYEGLYQVNNAGEVRSVKAWRNKPAFSPLFVTVNYADYLIVTLYRSGRKTFTIHSLVMLAFVGQRPDGMHINHKNGNRQDNRLQNLEYVTPSENAKHAVHVLGRETQKGEKNGAAKLNPDAVRQIRQLCGNGAKYVEVAKQFGVTDVLIRLIAIRRLWKHVE